MENLKESSAKTHGRSPRFLSAGGGGLLAGAATLLGLLATQGTARAEYTVTYEQVGSDVVATGSGTLDTAAMTYGGYFPEQPYTAPSNKGLATGASAETDQWFGTITGPSSFGAGGQTFASSGSGDLVRLQLGRFTSFDVPQGYVSGSPLSDTATYSGETLAGLGLTPGDYTWTWGSGPTADSFNLDIGAVPEPTSVALFGLGGLALLARRQARQRGVKPEN